MVKKSMNWCMVAVFCLLLLPTAQASSWSMSQGMTTAKSLSRDFTALALDGVDGSSTVKQELGKDYTTLVFGCYTCLNSTATATTARSVLDSLGYEDYPVLLLDIKSSSLADVKTAQSKYDNILLSVVEGDSSANNAFWEISRACYSNVTDIGMPAMVILDSKGEPVYCSSDYDTGKSLYQEVMIELTGWTDSDTGDSGDSGDTDDSGDSGTGSTNTYSITGTNVNYPSQGQIASYYSSKNIYNALDSTATYDTKPSFSSPYDSGDLTSATVTHALNTFNYVRYVAGLSYNVTSSANYTNLAQDASYLNYLNKSMSHYPETPTELSDAIYSDLVTSGKLGAKSSNIAIGYPNLPLAITNGWMNDGDTSNIEVIGHRRWILNPTMSSTGFGIVSGENGNHSAMYAFDNSFGSTSTTGVMWPAQNMPLDLFDSEYPWSFSTGSEINGTVTVTLTRLNDDKVWTFSSSDTNKSGKYFNVDNDFYGKPGCIIFRPAPSDISYQDGDVFRVEIKGAVTASYCVSFFDINSVSGSTSNLTPTSTPSSVTLDISDRAVFVTGVTASASKTSLEVGETTTVTATISPSNATNKAVSWKSSNTAVATVSSTGAVTAVATGSTTITATTSDGNKTATVKLTVTSSTVAVTGVSLSQSTASLSVGSSLTLTATVSPSNATTTGLTWESSDTDVATVSTTGKITALGEGTATITVTTDDGGKTASCKLTVTEKADTTLYTVNTSTSTSGSSATGGTVSLNQSEALAGTEIKVYVTINEGFTLSAIEVNPEDDCSVTLSVSSGGSYYYFTQPACDTTVTLEFTALNQEEDCEDEDCDEEVTDPDDSDDSDDSDDLDEDTTTPSTPSTGQSFSDVKSSDWYYGYVSYVTAEGLMSGTSPSTFGADAKTERGMIVTTLYNMAGKTPVTASSKFTDVSNTDYFYGPCIWANQEGIVNGVDETSFDPYAPVTREQICLILYKYAQTQTNLLTGYTPNASFTDSGSISDWAKEGVNWCSSMSVVNGKADGSFDPSASASRGEIATMLTNFSILIRS